MTDKPPQTIRPGTFGDGLPRAGTPAATVHRGELPAYDDTPGHKYRALMHGRTPARPHRKFPNR
jgi:hypothetical protein